MGRGRELGAWKGVGRGREGHGRGWEEGES